MASLPQRQASQRREPSSNQQSTTTTNSQSTEETSTSTSTSTPSSTVRTYSEDSQTLFLSSPTHDEQQEQQEQDEQPESQSQPQAQSNTPTTPPPINRSNTTTSTSGTKKCWICFSDSSEDTPTTSPWRSPCPCALVAHEACLLDWIADLEAPTNRRTNRSFTAPKIACPQCKAEIHLSRPRNPIVSGVRALERLSAQLITPGALTVLVGMVYNTSLAWGVHSIYAIFGADDGFRILRPLLLNTVRPPIEFNNATPRRIAEQLLGIGIDHLVHWRLYLGLPLITPVLILSRTALADSVLPVLPILFFATQTPSPTGEPFDFAAWPPSASLAFAVLPYLRSAYNMYYARVWSEREKQWLREVQPRVGQDESGEGGDPEADAVARDREDGNVFEVRIDGWDNGWEDEVEMLEDEDEEEEEEGEGDDAVPVPDAPPPPLQFPGIPEPPAAQDAQADPPPNIPDNRDGAQQPRPQQANAQNRPAGGGGGGAAPGERRLSFSPTSIAETILGALVFPALAGLSGELLKLALPASWTAMVSSSSGGGRGATGRLKATGLLQEKWGRSLVGGCLFVAVKDAVMLYVRWRMAGMQRSRRVLDYDGEKKRGKT